MRRISNIRSSREVTLEMHREELRNVRWARRRNQIVTVAGVASTLVFLFADSGPEYSLRVVEKLLGI
jgi:hypothetical protein